MHLATKIMIAIVAIEHVYILWLEMFGWTTVGRKTFKSLAPELFEPTKSLAANQGLYNGFLAAGLCWSLLISEVEWAKNVALFFLACVVIAGIYGGLTASKGIIIKQALPAAIALLLLLLL